MDMQEKMTFKVTGQDGKEIEYEVLFTFESDETKKNYMVYTDNTKDEAGNIRVYAATYKPEDEKTMLEPIETEKEWTIIETILNEIQEQAKEEAQENGDEQ